MVSIWVHPVIAEIAKEKTEWEFVVREELTTLRQLLLDAFGGSKNLLLSIIDEQSNLRPNITIYIGNDNVRSKYGLETKIEDGNEVSIFTLVSGG
jgi:molybdopterin converting factor small subunit